MEDLIQLIEDTANMLRGMCMDPRIPQDTKQAMWSRVARLDKAAEDALEAMDADAMLKARETKGD